MNIVTIIRVITVLALVVMIGSLGLILYSDSLSVALAYDDRDLQLWLFGSSMLVLISAAWFTWPRRTRNTP